MSHNPAQPPATDSQTSSLKMVLTMAGIGLFCGVLIVLTYQVTFPVIAVNKARALEQAIFDVVPNATSKTTFTLSAGTLQRDDEGEVGGSRYYACYDDARELVGVAVEASGQGFQDVLRIIYGYSPRSHNIVGMKVLESKETPGLGDKIEKDAAFRANFDALEVKLSADGGGIENPIELTKKGKKDKPWQVEAITGATISARAIATILRESTKVNAPVIVDNLETLEGGAQ